MPCTITPFLSGSLSGAIYIMARRRVRGEANSFVFADTKQMQRSERLQHRLMCFFLSDKWNVLFGPQRKNMKRETGTGTHGSNRPLNQFVQRQDKAQMQDFLRWQPPLTPPVQSLASLPHFTWLNSVHSLSDHFFPPARAAGNKLTESKWGSEEDKVFTICGIYCSPRSCGRLIRVELLECRFPFWNNVFHAYNRRKNYSSKWMPSNLVANNPARWYDLSS